MKRVMFGGLVFFALTTCAFSIIWVYPPDANPYIHYAGYLCFLLGIVTVLAIWVCTLRWTHGLYYSGLKTCLFVIYIAVTFTNVVLFLVSLTANMEYPVLRPLYAGIFDYTFFGLGYLIIHASMLPNVPTHTQ